MSSSAVSWKYPLAKAELGPEEFQAVQKVLESGWLSQGPVTEAFEQEFARFLGVRHAIAVSNGTAALHLAHLVAGIGPQDEVICPSLSFVATANSIAYTGARPVFGDIEGRDSLCLSPADAASRITSRTRAITLMHYGGFACDVAAFRKLAADRGLTLIEDAAHALGSQAEGAACGAAGRLGCFSFFANKNLVCGEGGMVVTHDDEQAAALRQLRSHGMSSMTWDRHRGIGHDYDVIRLGFNYRMDEIRAALGLAQLRKLPEMNRRRRILVERYQAGLQGVEEIHVPFAGRAEKSSCHLMAVVLGEGISRERFRRILLEEGIQTSVHYPAIHATRHYRRSHPFVRLPQTDLVSRRVVTLPLYPSLETEQVDGIVKRVREAVVHSRHTSFLPAYSPQHRAGSRS